MIFNQRDLGKSLDLEKNNQKMSESDAIENLDYLYPNGHRITHQMRWFKVSRDIGLNFNSNITA